MRLEEAREIAEGLCERMKPYCLRACVAGSIRRGKVEVGDIEICAIPKWEERKNPADLFGEAEPMNLLHEWARKGSGIRWIKTGTNEIISWEIKPEGKYWRAYLGGVHMKLDLFLARPANWGAILLIRTGSAEFSHAVAAHAQRIRRPFKDGQIWWGDRPVVTADEETAFRLLRLQWIPPEERTGPEALRGAS